MLPTKSMTRVKPLNRRALLGRNGPLAVGIGAAGGAGFYALDLPLPWVLGAIASTALVALSNRIDFEVPKAWRNGAMVAIGIMLGTGFDSGTLSTAVAWMPSILLMLLLSVIFFFLTFVVFYKYRNMDPATAFLAAAPGGASVVSVIADAYDADLRRILLAHTARLICLLALAPIIVKWLSGMDLSLANTAAMTGCGHECQLETVWLVLLGAIAWFVALRISVPSALLLVPLVLSAVVHAAGWLNGSVPPPLAITAQVLIGTNIGVRFCGYRMDEIAYDGLAGIATGVAMALCCGAVAAALGWWTMYEPASIFLSYLPGGAPEIGTVSLVLGISPAMVATHHLIRVLFLAFVIGPAMNHLGAQASKSKTRRSD